MLRFDSALQLFERTATAQVEVGGVVVEPGQKIAALLGAANRDPAVFADADLFDVRRDPNPHLAFGVGVHFCLGAPLARMELAESLAALFASCPGPASGRSSRRVAGPSYCADTAPCPSPGQPDDRVPAMPDTTRSR